MSRRELQGVIKVGEFGIFVQENGSSPATKPFYRGNIQFGGWNEPQGDLTPQYIQNPDRPNDWLIADVTQAGPGLPNSDATLRLNNELVRTWYDIKRKRCPVNIQIKHDDCDAVDDLNAWDYKDVFVQAYITDFTGSLVAPLSGDDNAPSDESLSWMALRSFKIFPIGFEEIADATINAEVIAGFYGGSNTCGGKCGKREDITDRLYVLTKSNQGSPGLSSQVVFSVDDLQTFANVDISTLGGLDANDMVKMGSFVIVVSQNTASHHYINITELEDEDASAWAEITDNYVGGVLAAYSQGAAEAYLAGANGYAYKLTDPEDAPTVLTDGSITIEDLTHVRGWGATVVWAGDNGTVLVSNNNGDSIVSKGITLSDGSTISGNVTALDLISPNIWFLAVDGSLYYTLDNGETYDEKTLEDGINIINDIKFANQAVGYLVTQNAGDTNQVYRTDSSGALWSRRAPYITGLPTADRYVVAIPCGENEVAVGGRIAVGGDGILAVAT